MKPLILIMAVVLSASVYCDQGILETKGDGIKTNVIVSPIKGLWQNTSFNIPEKYAGKFERTFLKKKSSISLFQIENLREESLSKVIFNGRKGKLRTDFERNETLLDYFLRFKDVLMPYNLVTQFYKEKEDRTLLSNSYKTVCKKDFRTHFIPC